MGEGRKARRKNSSEVWQVGEKIARDYRVLGFLGRGGEGTVYRVQHVERASEYALKVLAARRENREELECRFVDRILATKRLVDPTIVRVRDHGTTNRGELFYTMDLCRGISLRAILETEERLEPYRAMSIVSDVLRGISVAHQHGIVHRDIKPANVLIDSRRGIEAVRIIDFGIAAHGGGASSKSRRFEGTLHYAAPEQTRGRAARFESDVFAAGVVLYQCLSGSTPFHGANLREYTCDLLTRRAIPPSEIVPSLASVPSLEASVLRALEVDPESRYPSAKEFRADLERILRTRGVRRRSRNSQRSRHVRGDRAHRRAHARAVTRRGLVSNVQLLALVAILAVVLFQLLPVSRGVDSTAGDTTPDERTPDTRTRTSTPVTRSVERTSSANSRTRDQRVVVDRLEATFRDLERALQNEDMSVGHELCEEASMLARALKGLEATSALERLEIVRGRFAVLRGDWDEALELLQGPASSGATTDMVAALARAEWKLGMTARARGRLQSLGTLGSHKAAARTLLEMCLESKEVQFVRDCVERIRGTTVAIELAEELVRAVEHAKTLEDLRWKKLGGEFRIALEAQNHDAIVRLGSSILARRPSFAVGMAVANAQRAFGDLAGAAHTLADLDSVVRIDESARAEFLVLRAEVELARPTPRLSRALGFVEEALTFVKPTPRDRRELMARAKTIQARCHAARQDIDAADTAIRGARKLDDSSPNRAYIQACVYLHLAEIDPSSRMLLGRALSRFKHFREIARDDDSRVAFSLYAQGWCFVRYGDRYSLNEAIRRFVGAHNLGFSEARLFREWSLALRKCGKVKAAERILSLSQKYHRR